MGLFLKGRMAVTAGLIAFTTATVLVGSSAASNVKVGSGGGNSNDPHGSDCVQLKDVPANATGVQFTLVAPTAGPQLYAQFDGNVYNLAQALSDTNIQPTNQGWHVQVSYAGSQKTVWVQPDAACVAGVPVG